MPYLFQCSIGPVQDFIATARRSRDLWYGSWMLSELSKAAAQTLADYDLIFPAPRSEEDLKPDSDLSVANKVVAVVTDPPHVVGQKVNEAVNRRLTQLRETAFAKVGNPSQFLADLAKAQINDLVEFYWVTVEILDGPEGYSQARSLADRTLGARKTTRDFNQFNPDIRQPKSSLDGTRESVIDEQAYPSPNAGMAEKQAKATALYRNFGARPAERLSGVDLLKRLGLGQNKATESSFPSTSNMAALPFLCHVDNNDGAGSSSNMLAEIRAMFDESGIPNDEDDGAIVFESRLAEWVEDPDLLKTVKDSLNAILAKYAGGVKPAPYYALLIADGDNMGATIDNQHTADAHRTLSQTLADFAVTVTEIIERHKGSLVYAGGDDVMAYLPLHTVLPCAEELANTFYERMKSTGFTTNDGTIPTLSAGVAIAHHLTPLSNTLSLARMAEKVAKGVPGKNALAITVSKRSGTDRTIVGKRNELGERLRTMVDWSKEGRLAAGTPYELQRLSLTLGKSGISQDGLTNEAARIVERKRERGGGEMDQETKKEMAAQFESWLQSTGGSLLEVTHEMIVAKQLADAAEMADGPKKGDA